MPENESESNQGSTPFPEEEPVAKQQEAEGMTFIEHLGELRDRLIRGVLYVLVASAICWTFSESIYDFLLQPLCKAQGLDVCSIYPREMMESFFVYFKTGLLSGFVLSSPFWMYECWSFVAPGLYPHEKRYTRAFGAVGGVLFIGGAVFGFSVAFPFIYKFLLGFAGPEWVEFRISMKHYAKLTTTLILAFAVIFQMPLFVLFMVMLGLVTPQGLSKGRPYVIVAILGFSAVLTPTVDPLSFLVVSLPMLLLFELGLLLAKGFQKMAVYGAMEDGD